MMYVFELLQCKAMEVPDGSGNLKWYYMKQRTALHLRLLAGLELLQRHLARTDQRELLLLLHDEVHRPHLDHVRHTHVELLDELAAQRRHLHRRPVLTQDLLQLIRHGQGLQGGVVADHRDLRALQHELLPALDEVIQLRVDADSLQSLVRADAVPGDESIFASSADKDVDAYMKELEA